MGCVYSSSRRMLGMGAGRLCSIRLYRIVVSVRPPVSGSVLTVSIATWHLAELLEPTGPEILHFQQAPR